MGESLSTPGVAYAGVLATWFAFVLCVVLFERRRWASLLFWMAIAFGASLGQAHALWVADDVSWPVLWTSAAIGAVLCMPAGGIAADWWQDRLGAELCDEPDLVERGSPVPEPTHAPVDLPEEYSDDEPAIELDDYPIYETEPV